MKRRDEGHPLAAMLLLASMFAFALVFHALTQPGEQLSVRYDHQLAALAVPATSEPPSFAAPAPITRSPSPIVSNGVVTETPTVAPAADPLLDAVAWSTIPVMSAATVSAVAPAAGRESGVVTRAVATTRSALRNAFRKTF